ncbi:MAG: MFS transporter [Sciscionella sp.]|nr:MFS transporter [Sciscionella sp.]
MLLMFLARIPSTAAGMLITLHVVLTLHHGYGAAGFVGAAVTLGIAAGAPLMGRLVDAAGLRKMLAITTLGEGAFWLLAWLLPYSALLPCAFAGGLLSLPAMSIGRQSMAALVPVEYRRTAYSLDSISVEFTYMIGPAVAVLLATRFSSSVAMICTGVAILLAGGALFVINPAMRAEHELADEVPPRRSWLGPAMIGVLVAGLAAVLVLSGQEVAAVAALRGVGQVGWTGAVTFTMCLASATGGVIYGALRRTPSTAILLALLALLTVPAGLLGGTWWVLALILMPSNLICAPTLTSINDTISQLAPAGARGEANGLGSSAFTLGAAAGAPLIGVIVDKAGPVWGFAAAGIVGVAIACVVALLMRDRDPGAEPHHRPLAPLGGSPLP